MEASLFYFFSTLAQSFAALTALVFMAAQYRVAWLDAKITSTKMALLFRIHGGTQQIEYYMASKSATQVIEEGLKNTNTTTQSLATELKGFVDQIQGLRRAMQIFTVVGIVLTAVGIVGIALVPTLKNQGDDTCATVLKVCSVLAVIGAVAFGIFIYGSVKVSLKKSV